MKFKILKTENNVAVVVNSEITHQMLSVVSDEARCLKDKEGNVTFVIQPTFQPSIEEFALGMPARSFIVSMGNLPEETLQRLKYKIATCSKNAKKVEAQIKKEYEELTAEANAVEVVEE